MGKVAKVVIIDKDDRYLLLYRSQHPLFGDDPDLPGGTLEEGELPLGAMMREVQEEIGAEIDATRVREVYAGTEYSMRGTHYSLFIAQVSERPPIVMSWEHSAYDWLERDTFLEQAKNAKDIYMHMVYAVLNTQ